MWRGECPIKKVWELRIYEGKYESLALSGRYEDLPQLTDFRSGTAPRHHSNGNWRFGLEITTWKIRETYISK
jgi:hypothetical protein